MKILVEALWDEEAGVWVAEATGDFGLVTEAASIEDLWSKLSTLVPDLIGPEYSGPIEIELLARSFQTIAA